MGDELTKSFIKSVSSKLSTLSSAITGTTSGMTESESGPGTELGTIINTLTCPVGSECYKTKHNTYLQNKMKLAKTNLKDAPIDLSRAERNYYEYNGGGSGGKEIYRTLISDRFNETVAEFKQNSIARQQQYMADIAQLLKQYESEVDFQMQSDKMLEIRQTEQADLLKKINYYQKILQTSERKVVFENKNSDSLYSYRRIMIFLYYASIVGFILFANFIPDKLYTKISVWLLIVIASIIPIILNIAVMWIFAIYDMIAYWLAELPHQDVYRHLGEEATRMPMPSTATAPPMACPAQATTGTATSSQSGTSTSSTAATKRTPLNMASMPVIPAETKAAMMSAMSPSMAGLFQ
jgi:hypothetical protein